MSSPTSDPPTSGTARGGAGGMFGPYRLGPKLGEGAMGEVFQAYDTVHRRTIALKLLVPKLADDPAYQARFVREAELAAQLNNPHVIPIHRYGSLEGRLFIEMALVEGTDLDSALGSGPLPAPAAVDIAGQVADALDAAHDAKLVHRDVK